jgi:hypothetical protein
MKGRAMAACLTAAAILVATHPARGTDEAARPPLFVRAWVSTAGSYGQNWYFLLTPEGEAHLQVFYNSPPSGNLLGRFSLSEERVRVLHEALESEKFFDLPSEISPAQRGVHRPLLQMEVHLGDRNHKVPLYDPDAVKQGATKERFLAIWRWVFEGLPFKPSW